MTFSTKSTTTSNPNQANKRRLTPAERDFLEQRGCTADNWDLVTIQDDTDLKRLRDVDFAGHVSIGRLQIPAAISRARIEDCEISDDVTIRNIGRRLYGCQIGRGVRIENVGAVEYDSDAACGSGVEVSPLDETGSRPVIIYPGISAQLAALQARMPEWAKEKRDLFLQAAASRKLTGIGEEAVIADCGTLRNVYVGPRIKIEGADWLKNGAVINNADPGKEFAAVGHGVHAENFIIEDGRVDGASFVHNCYIGQGAEIDKGFTAHDSLFFANCTCENGESCALLAGPYSVSVHKSTLLIATETSFANAGSNTNQSNHMYKMGPIHWGLMERGVKTASGSYVMWGARIGAFSMLMGTHKGHPDTSDFPFSYLFADDKGTTTIVPGLMLKSCGLRRDQQKWRNRDRRQGRGLPVHDRITYGVFNPFTIGTLLKALRFIPKLIRDMVPDEQGIIRWRNMKLSGAGLARAKQLYEAAVRHYIYILYGDIPVPEAKAEPEDWVDLAGQTIPRHVLKEVMAAPDVESMERILTEADRNQEDAERRWIADALGTDLRYLTKDLRNSSEWLQRMADEDKSAYERILASEAARLSL